jgi:hypothetical protein
MWNFVNTKCHLCCHYEWSFLKASQLPHIIHFLGLGFRPSPPVDNVESTLIWYKGTDPEQYEYWTKNLEKFLEGNKRTRVVVEAGLHPDAS